MCAQAHLALAVTLSDLRLSGVGLQREDSPWALSQSRSVPEAPSCARSRARMFGRWRSPVFAEVRLFKTLGLFRCAVLLLHSDTSESHHIIEQLLSRTVEPCRIMFFLRLSPIVLSASIQSSCSPWWARPVFTCNIHCRTAF